MYKTLFMNHGRYALTMANAVCILANIKSKAHLPAKAQSRADRHVALFGVLGSCQIFTQCAKFQGGSVRIVLAVSG